MRKTTYFIDTNIIIYARGKDHVYKKSCSQLILKIADGSFQEKFGIPVTDSEVFQEIIYRYALINKWQTAISVCQDFMTLGLEVLPVGSDQINKLLELALRYNKTGITPRDLVHAAVMLTNNVKNIITVDTHFNHIKGIKRIDPVMIMK